MAASLSIAFTTTPLAAGKKLFIYATRPLSAGAQIPVDAEFKLITVTAAAATSPLNVLAAYQAVYGVQPLATQKVYIKAVPVVANGCVGPATISAAIAT